MDSLEEKIQTLKEALQTVEQPDRMAIWQGIVPLEPKPKKPFFSAKHYWIIAAIIILLWGGFIWWWHSTQSQRKEAAAIAHLPIAWQVKAREYQVLIRHREQQVQIAQRDNKAITDELQVLNELDRLQASFLADFETLPKNERTAARYLRYYEQKMRIMELIFKKIDIQKYEQERNIQHQG